MTNLATEVKALSVWLDFPGEEHLWWGRRDDTFQEGLTLRELGGLEGDDGK